MEGVQSQQPQLPQVPREERTLLSRTYHRRTRAVTRISIAVCIASCLVYDWDTYLGTDKHVFSGIRPAVRRTLDWCYGIEAPPTVPRRTRSQVVAAAVAADSL